MYKDYIEAKLLLDDINEISNSVLWYMFNQESINDIEELFYSVKTIPDRIIDIKKILEKLYKEMMENENYFES